MISHSETDVNGSHLLDTVQQTPTITMVIHRPILPTGSNGWGTALYHGYDQYLADNGGSMRIISAPPVTHIPNMPSLSGTISYATVPVGQEVFDGAKRGAIDVHAWDLMHLIRTNGSPLVCEAFNNDHEGYIQTWKDFFVYSLNAAHTALTAAYNDDVPIFHLNDVHDSFVSALFEGNYDRTWLKEIVGPENELLVDAFEELRENFLSRHESIHHMRFWHTPSVEPDSWNEWFKLDPNTAAHFFAGIVSSPLVVHAPVWRDEFERLIQVALPQVAQFLEIGSAHIYKGIGVGPIGYDRTAFTKRFSEYDWSGQYQKVPAELSEMASSIRAGVGDKDPIVMFITGRGDDPKNNMPETIDAITHRAQVDPDFRDRVAVICVYSTSRIDESCVYEETANAITEKMQRLASVVGPERAIQKETVGGDLTYQTAGFLLANAFVCAARGGFDIVGMEASIVAALRANNQLAPEYQEIMVAHRMDNSFHVVMADTVGAAPYLHSMIGDYTGIESENGRMPNKAQISKALGQAWQSLSSGQSKILNGQRVLDDVDKICSAQDCIEQWNHAALTGKPQDHERTKFCVDLVDQMVLGTHEVFGGQPVLALPTPMGDSH